METFQFIGVLNLGQGSYYATFWPLVTLNFIQSYWFVLSGHRAYTVHFGGLNVTVVMMCHFYWIKSVIFAGFYWFVFTQNPEYLTYCRVSECPPSLKMCPRWSNIKINGWFRGHVLYANTTWLQDYWSYVILLWTWGPRDWSAVFYWIRLLAHHLN